MLDSTKDQNFKQEMIFVNRKNLENKDKEKDFVSQKSKKFRKWIKDVKLIPDEPNDADDLSNEAVPEKKDFLPDLRNLTKDLIYISETDADIFPFVGETSENVDSDSLFKQIEADTNTVVEERDFEDFFERLTKKQDWFEEEEIEMAENFLKLKNYLKKNLKDLKVFKVGEIQKQIYVVGLDSEKNLIGIKTEAVET